MHTPGRSRSPRCSLGLPAVSGSAEKSDAPTARTIVPTPASIGWTDDGWPSFGGRLDQADDAGRSGSPRKAIADTTALTDFPSFNAIAGSIGSLKGSSSLPVPVAIPHPKSRRLHALGVESARAHGVEQRTSAQQPHGGARMNTKKSIVKTTKGVMNASVDDVPFDTTRFSTTSEENPRFEIRASVQHEGKLKRLHVCTITKRSYGDNFKARCRDLEAFCRKPGTTKKAVLEHRRSLDLK